MRFNAATRVVMQTSTTAPAADSVTATATQSSEPEIRTPQNAGFMQVAYVVAAVIYGGYLLILHRRWSALRKRRDGATLSRR